MALHQANSASHVAATARARGGPRSVNSPGGIGGNGGGVGVSRTSARSSLRQRRAGTIPQRKIYKIT